MDTTTGQTKQSGTGATSRQMNQILLTHGELVVQQASMAQKRPIIRNPDWLKHVPYLGGVYVLWRNQVGDWIPIYVGESSNLWDRLYEMTCLGRHNAIQKLVDKEGETPIRNVSILERPEINGIHVSFVQLPIGRKEAEEFLIAKWRKTLINKFDKRFQRRTDWQAFEWLQKDFSHFSADAK
ncbi:hypothetical protein [Pedosphaera parvula]|uniref:GIY-YIG domain-containing protein n=1 Tax=Pedosphaera parvula (strain Ellin514) TaxID=320771 RepID=B9X9Z0_PEDPL|nr:hypothetical protein [Pedosphaera parvula]EEF63331.1 hypothetical protein Cflav_PD5966 [Pedosphaera parvula Ellin514]